jgi:acetolactate synthase-1/3 small subunit
VASVYHADIVDMSPTTLVLEATGSPAKLDSLLAMLEPFGLRELVRTGRVGLARGAGSMTDSGLSAVPASQAS